MLSHYTQGTGIIGNNSDADWLPAGSFFFFLTSFALDTQRCYGSRFQPFVRNLLTTPFTNTVGMARQSSESLVDFFEKLLFSLSDAERKILIGFGGSLIAHIRKTVHPFPVGQNLLNFLKNIRPLPFQVSLNIAVFALVPLATMSFRQAPTF